MALTGREIQGLAFEGMRMARLFSLLYNFFLFRSQVVYPLKWHYNGTTSVEKLDFCLDHFFAL